MGGTATAHEVLVVPGHDCFEHPTLHRDWPHSPVPVNEGVLQLFAFAKYTVAFPRM